MGITSKNVGFSVFVCSECSYMLQEGDIYLSLGHEHIEKIL